MIKFLHFDTTTRHLLFFKDGLVYEKLIMLSFPIPNNPQTYLAFLQIKTASYIRKININKKLSY